MSSVFVISIDGEKLMPTTRLGKVRHWLKSGKAKIITRRPFTIQLLFKTTTYTQPVELCMDTGYQHIGISIKSERKEYVSEERTLLPDEKERRDSQRKIRRGRRNRKRYRKSRFNNRKKPTGWLAPSVRNKADRHIDLIKSYIAAVPITDIYLEMGEFDIQVLTAVQEGKPVPEGLDYRHGAMYGADTLRNAVFQRDNYTCQVCGRNTFKNNAILHCHHMYFWKGRHGNRPDELITVCEKCHTPKNHKEGGKLWGFDRSMANIAPATFMNIVRWYIWNQVKAFITTEVILHITYGAVTKRSRLELNLDKSHANDAYSMGEFRPSVRATTEYYKKRRRNNRKLEKFYDAKYIDIRDGQKKSGSELGCQRTNRREARMSEKNQRIYHGHKVSKGRRTIRYKRYAVSSGAIILYRNQKIMSSGMQSNGTRVSCKLLRDGEYKLVSISVKAICLLQMPNGWIQI